MSLLKTIINYIETFALSDISNKDKLARIEALIELLNQLKIKTKADMTAEEIKEILGEPPLTIMEELRKIRDKYAPYNPYY